MPNVGKVFFDGIITVTAVGREAALRWFHYYRMCRFSKNIKDKELRQISEACLEDEFDEMKKDNTVMGVGLYIYNQCA